MTSSSLAPVAVFAFNRPLHLEKTLKSLASNLLARGTDVYVFCDGPRDNCDLTKVQETRQILRQDFGFNKLIVYESEINLGLATSIINGVTKISSEFERVIVLEDDMLTSPYFLSFMNEGLEKYSTDERVISIHGYVCPIQKPFESPFFLKGTDCWGWATWARGWKHFEKDSALLRKKLLESSQVNEFNFNGGYDYFQMLSDNAEGKNNSWAIRWYASAFLNNKLTLYPPQSLIENIGLDSTGTHCDIDHGYSVQLWNKPVSLLNIDVEESRKARKAYELFFRSQRSFTYKFKNKVLKWLK